MKILQDIAESRLEFMDTFKIDISRIDSIWYRQLRKALEKLCAFEPTIFENYKQILRFFDQNLNGN